MMVAAGLLDKTEEWDAEAMSADSDYRSGLSASERGGPLISKSSQPLLLIFVTSLVTLSAVFFRCVRSRTAATYSSQHELLNNNGAASSASSCRSSLISSAEEPSM